MDNDYKRAFKEVYEILKMMPEELVNRIPKSFIEVIITNMDKDYMPNIKEPIEEQELLMYTKVILGMVYRDFLCSPIEREELKKKDALKLLEAQRKLEEESRIKFDPDNIFKEKRQKIIKIEENDEEKSLVKYENEKWYKKIFKIVKDFFNRKNN